MNRTLPSPASLELPTLRAAEQPTLELATVFRTHLGYVWNSLRRLGVPDRDLEDIAHEVFLVVQRRLASFDRARPIRPWLFGIAFRCAVSYRRRAGRSHERLATDDDDAPDVASPEPLADERIADAEDRASVWQALEELPLERRAVVVLHDFEEITVPEIAAALEVPVRTAYSRLRLGREELIAALRRRRSREEGS